MRGIEISFEVSPSVTSHWNFLEGEFHEPSMAFSSPIKLQTRLDNSNKGTSSLDHYIPIIRKTKDKLLVSRHMIQETDVMYALLRGL